MGILPMIFHGRDAHATVPNRGGTLDFQLFDTLRIIRKGIAALGLDCKS